MRTCSSKEQLESNITDFKIHLTNRGCQETLITNTVAEINFDNRNVALKQEPKARKKILPFVTKFNPAASNIKSMIMKNWYLIQKSTISQRLTRMSKTVKLALLKKQTKSNSGHKTLIKIMNKVVQAYHPLTPIVSAVCHFTYAW